MYPNGIDLFKVNNENTKTMWETCSFFFFTTIFFLICKAEQPLRGMELEEKKHKKRLQDTENLFRKYL